VLKFWLTLLAAVVLGATGCSSGRKKAAKPPPLPAEWESEIAAARSGGSPKPKPAPSVPGSPTNAPALVTNLPIAPTPAPAPKPAERVQPLPETGMVALSLWAKQNGFGAVRKILRQPKPAYTLATTGGVFTCTEGSLAAQWQGLEVRLGFAPKVSDDQVYLEALDIRKVLETLARGTAVGTPTNRLVVIDPGHGGDNTGTRNIYTRRHEKDYTLDWARRLAPLLEQQGWRVKLTRTNDATLGLPERVAFTESLQADLFLSLHFNATGNENPEPAGLETYCLTPTGMPSSLTRDFDDDPDASFPNNAFDAQNLRYAVRLHQALLRVNGGKDRGVRFARFPDVLRGHRRPAVLIEGGYCSNPIEARQIADPAFRQKLAEAVAAALP
jgi:N-acetylmuramoyl-L-alanine amidase